MVCPRSSRVQYSSCVSVGLSRLRPKYEPLCAIASALEFCAARVRSRSSRCPTGKCGSRRVRTTSTGKICPRTKSGGGCASCRSTCSCSSSCSSSARPPWFSSGSTASPQAASSLGKYGFRAYASSLLSFIVFAVLSSHCTIANVYDVKQSYNLNVIVQYSIILR